jgi:putative endonuclease
LRQEVLGPAGEELVANFLEKQGFVILQKNFSCRFGEIDVIAQKDEILAFIEVKTRSKYYFPISTVVTPSKQRKIVKTAKLFLLKKNIVDKACRFDVATVLWEKESHEIDYIENAFYGH